MEHHGYHCVWVHTYNNEDEYDEDVMQHGGHTPANWLTESYFLDSTSRLRPIDTCQNKISADQYHMAILQAHT